MEYELLQEMKKKILEIEVEKISLKSKILVLEKATIASLPLRFGALPKLLAGLLLGVFLISGLIFGWDSLLVTVKHRNDFQELEIPILGTSPKLSQGFWSDWLSALPARLRPKKEVSLLDLWQKEGDAPLVMAFNHIRSRAFKLRSSEGSACRVFSVVGAKPGDGKSFVSVNLALSLAKTEKRVLLLDTDLRRSSVAETLGMTEDKGLSDVLTGKAALEKMLIKNFAPHLDVLLSGPSVRRSTELLSSPAFGSLFEILKNQYDYLIVDTPAVLPVVDALEVASLSDVCILTATFGKTKWQDLENAVEKVRSMVAKPMVAIFNQVPEMHEYVYLSHSKKTARTVSKPESKKVDVKKALARFSETISKEKT